MSELCRALGILNEGHFKLVWDISQNYGLKISRWEFTELYKSTEGNRAETAINLFMSYEGWTQELVKVVPNKLLQTQIGWRRFSKVWRQVAYHKIFGNTNFTSISLPNGWVNFLLKYWNWFCFLQKIYKILW